MDEAVHLKAFKKEEHRLQEYEAFAGQDLAYRDLNTRFSDWEKMEYKDAELSARLKQHQENKLKIEEAWHQDTAEKAEELTKRENKAKKTEAAFYSGFTLAEMETLVKNSNRGGNSFEYNNVATDLELYNRIRGNGEEGEELTLLKNLKESSAFYLKTKSKSPWTTKGKVRRAMIQRIYDEASKTLEDQLKSIREAREESLKKMRREVVDQNVNEAFKAHFDMMQQVISGNMELSEEELKKLDTDMEEVLNKLKDVKIDEESQSDTLSTRFFNALGWSSNPPRVVKDNDLEKGGKEEKKSPLKKKMYHAMVPLPGHEDAVDLAKQLAGTSEKNNRLYYGLGRFGKGIYTSTRSDNKEALDYHAYINSWSYGYKKGSTMMTMMLNEHARITTTPYVKHKMAEIEKLFGKSFRILRNSDGASKGGHEDYLTMFAALLGYNTIHGDSGFDNEDYYTTSNRKALSISREVQVRTTNGSKGVKEDVKDSDYKTFYLDTNKMSAE